MVLGYHLLFSTYGFWLPNDPRGSWSDFVRSWELFRYGPATKVATSRSFARAPHDFAFRHAAQKALRHPPVVLSMEQIHTVAQGFSQAAQEADYVIHVCSIMAHLKGRATQQLQQAGIHPLGGFINLQGQHPSPWSQRGWKVYLDSKPDIYRASQYVEENPAKEGKPRQQWWFVVSY